MHFIFNVCYIPFIPLSSKSSTEEMEEMSFFHFLPPVRKKVISSGRNSTLTIDHILDQKKTTRTPRIHLVYTKNVVIMSKFLYENLFFFLFKFYGWGTRARPLFPLETRLYNMALHVCLN